MVWVSPRQLAILLSSFLVGFSLSVPFPAPTPKLIVVGSMLLTGTMVAFWRVKMLTPEQLIVARLRGLTAISQANKREKAQITRPTLPSEEPFQIETDSAESFTPLSISGRWKRTKLPRKVSLYVDGIPRPGAEALATPVNETESGYAIVFLPTTADIGVRELEVRIEGEEKPIYRKKVEVKVKGARPLEMKKVD